MMDRRAPTRRRAMSKQKVMTVNSLWGEIFQAGLYKPSQGRVTRQVTCGSLWAAFAIGAYQAYWALYEFGEVWRNVLPLVLLIAGFWASYRLVNYARFADFLIAVEAEMNKVSWPSRQELVRSSIVVIFVIFSLALILFTYDLIWKFVFRDILRVIS
jgi:preprotein translocase subunit SecE